LPEFKLIMVELARALPALLFPPRKLRRGLEELILSLNETMAGHRRRSATAVLTVGVVGLGLGVRFVHGSTQLVE
jgi:hypothetical protein